MIMFSEPFEDIILAGLIPSSPSEHEVCLDNLRFTVEKLNLDLLPAEHRTLFACCRLFADDTGWSGALTDQALSSYLSDDRAGPEVVAKYMDLFYRAQTRVTTQADFRFALKRFTVNKRDERYAAILLAAETIRVQGLQVGKETLKGFEASVQYLRENLGQLDRGFSTDASPESDIRADAKLVVEEYKKRKENPEQFVGLLFGLDFLDRHTNGLQRGELGIIGGYTEAGKSHLLIQSGWHACTTQRKNVAFGITEMLVPQYRRRIALRHCRNERFGVPSGIDAERFKFGKLSEDEERALAAAMEDLAENPDYGQFNVFTIPAGAGFDYVVSKVTLLNSLWSPYGGLHGLYIDSLNQIVVDTKIEQTRLGLNQNIRRAKDLAISFDGGRGLAVLSPWHANRRSYETACEVGYYTLKSWSEADELERRADLIAWLLRVPGQEETREVTAGLEKYRDGKGHVRETLYEDFASGYLGTSANRYDPVDSDPQGAYGLY